MEIDLITRLDLERFRTQLLADILEVLAGLSSTERRRWLKGSEVRKLLGISPGSLQNLRISGQLKSSKVGGIYYYQYSDIERLMEQKT